MSSYGDLPKWLRELLREYGLDGCIPGAAADVAITDGQGAPGDNVVPTYEAPDSDDDITDGQERPFVRVKAVDLRVTENAEKHRTDKYEITQAAIDGKPNTPRLIVRRGQPFVINFTLTQAWADTDDKITIVLEMGKKPQMSKGTRVKLDLKNKYSSEDGWTADVVSHEGNTVHVRLATPPDAFVGELKLRIDTSRSLDGRRVPETVRYTHPYPLTLLFNPWCEGDQVYLDDEICRQEYVLNDVGKIYNGNWDAIRATIWNFGQFESVVLDCVLSLLNGDRNQASQRGNPSYVVRIISTLLNNSGDNYDNGVLTGRWDGKYDDGVPPLQWTGSESILEQYMETKRPVRYGQCWVFSGLVTSVCRALGIPCRSVTNFDSAHDHHQNINIDEHFDTDGDRIENENICTNDSTWNFHVWNDVWMARPDLPAGYGGWQAVDATPQELSGGVFRLGPASLVAVKRGEVHFQYDAPFVFSEVNGDKVQWEVDALENVRKLKVDEHSVGRYISTKKPTGKPPNKSRGPFTANKQDDEDRLDITSEYKFREGTEEERMAMKNALSALNVRRRGPGGQGEGTRSEDVKFELTYDKGVENQGVMIGQPVGITCHLQNTNPKEVREVYTNVTVHVVSYTGIRVAEVMKRKATYNLEGGQDFDVKLEVSPEDYLELLVDEGRLKVSAMCRVQETEQVYVNTLNVSFLRPSLDLQVPDEAYLNQHFEASIKIENPVKKMLTNCKLHMEGPGLQRPRIISLANIPSGEVGEATVELTPRRAGQRQLIVSFVSKQLSDVTGYATVVVKRPP